MSVSLLSGLLLWFTTWQTDGQPSFPLPTELPVYLAVLPVALPSCLSAWLSIDLPSCPSALLPAYQCIDQPLCFTGWAGGYGNLPNMNSRCHPFNREFQYNYVIGSSFCNSSVLSSWKKTMLDFLQCHVSSNVIKVIHHF
jgi:hypothetical protein